MDRDREACARRPPDDVLELGPAGDLDPRAVQHPRCLRAERPVHEGLDVADPEKRVSEASRDADLREPVDVVVRKRLPHPQREGAFPLELLEDGERSEPAVLVVDRDDAAGIREPDSLARGVHHLLMRRPHVEVAEMPRAFLAQDAGRLALLVALDDAAGNLEVAVRPSEGRRVQPERVVVARHERGRDVARDRVQGFLGRLDGGRPVAAPPAEPPEPASFGNRPDRVADPGERLVQ